MHPSLVLPLRLARFTEHGLLVGSHTFEAVQYKRAAVDVVGPELSITIIMSHSTQSVSSGTLTMSRRN
jgi:hypothetical protein